MGRPQGNAVVQPVMTKLFTTTCRLAQSLCKSVEDTNDK